MGASPGRRAPPGPGRTPQPSVAREPLGLRPLTARSVLLSVLLGTHPARLPVRALVRLGELFGISEGTVRVALSRMSADGEVGASDGWYDLSPRLLARQRHLDEGRSPQLRSWRGRWELAVVSPAMVGAARADLLERLGELRLAALRDGVWLRPANLARTWPGEIKNGCDRFDAGCEDDPAALAARLWDLDGWATRGEALLGGLTFETVPAGRFVVAAAIARHLRTDPVLPRALLPAGWPGPRLRRAYEAYEAELNGHLGRLATT